MHGMTTLDRVDAPSRLDGVRTWLYGHRRWFLIVALPTLLVSAYYLLIAANQYESEAHFMVRTSETTPTPTGLGQALTLVGGVTSSQSEAYSVGDYLTSHDAVAALQKQINIVQLFRRPEADLLSRLKSDPAAESLLKYYRDQVDVKFNSETGIATLRVRAFRPTDSYNIISTLLRLGESRVNTLNERAYQDTLSAARRRLDEAQANIRQLQGAGTSIRIRERDIDPKATGQAEISLVSQLQARLAQARAQAAAMSGSLSPNSPQLVAARARVSALQTEVSTAQGRLTAGNKSIATSIGGFQNLELQQGFAAKQYDAAAAALETARQQAIKQQLFVVRVVEPNMPEKALYPKSLKIIATVFFALMLIYAVGWLIAAGVREHAS